MGHTSFNADKTRVVYSLCDYNSGYNIACELHQASMEVDGTITNKSRIDVLNAQDATTTQPAIAYNTIDNTERLYFVSDRKGGKGGLDIWYATMDANGNYGEALNLSEVNSVDNEITPYYHSSTNEFFFSSDGYLGLGGYDVYKANLGQSSTPIHLGAPINSSYNDIYYVCLLYTSPSPRDQRGSRMPSSA